MTQSNGRPDKRRRMNKVIAAILVIAVGFTFVMSMLALIIAGI